MSFADFLKLGVAAAIVSTLGSLIALFIKEYFLTMHFERKREKKTIDLLFNKYRDPIMLAAMEYAKRLIEIYNGFPTEYLKKDILKVKPGSLTRNSAHDEHYLRYKLISTCYRMSALLGWLELYRQEITFLRSSNTKRNKELETCLDKLKNVLADGHIIQFDDWQDWGDYLIFREEQRAIGEFMIVNKGDSKGVMGFLKYVAYFSDKEKLKEHDALTTVINFNTDFKEGQDFRHWRYYFILMHMKELLILLDPVGSATMVSRIDVVLKQKEDDPVVLAYHEYLIYNVESTLPNPHREINDKIIPEEQRRAYDESASDEE
ncbi:MAG TPA: hypothetical protein VLA46_14015 [Saprospiraceae bacterium]|nr:hypothetical protein [Saprospiraceae bacterium]